MTSWRALPTLSSSALSTSRGPSRTLGRGAGRPAAAFCRVSRHTSPSLWPRSRSSAQFDSRGPRYSRGPTPLTARSDARSHFEARRRSGFHRRSTQPARLRRRGDLDQRVRGKPSGRLALRSTGGDRDPRRLGHARTTWLDRCRRRRPPPRGRRGPPRGPEADRESRKRQGPRRGAPCPTRTSASATSPTPSSPPGRTPAGDGETGLSPVFTPKSFDPIVVEFAES